MGKIEEPKPISPEMDVSEFSCGEQSLDDWIKKRALANQKTGATFTYAACDGSKVIGYYGCCAGMINIAELPKNLRRNMPPGIPAFIIARLAVDKRYQGRNLGKDLLNHAINTAIKSKSKVGIAFIAVQALHDKAAEFYLKYGFIKSPFNPHTLIYPLKGANTFN